jgi:NAD(P)-dependent dehydrogenase (short-subunit alcohol dehydrogenase family)
MSWRRGRAVDIMELSATCRRRWVLCRDAYPKERFAVAAKTWFITGASSGFGRIWATAALKRGDRVAATARNLLTLEDLSREYGDSLLPIELDVTDRAGDFAAIAEAHDLFGRIDVVVNNAGYGQLGCVEELSEQEARVQFDTNFFGALWITQAALPYLRARGCGHIIQVSSVAGLVSLPDISVYAASKYALEALSESLAHEVKPFGIHVTLIEPGGFATDFQPRSAKFAKPIPAYAETHQTATNTRDAVLCELGDPFASAAALFEIVDVEEPPLRVLFGSKSLEIVQPVYDERISNWQSWQHVAVQAQG